MNSIAPRVGQLVRLLGSTSDGEALAACRALDRTLKQVGRDFHDLARVAETHLAAPASERPTWQTRAGNLLRLAAGNLSKAEIDFLLSMSTWPSPPSEKQARWLAAIEKVLSGCAA